MTGATVGGKPIADQLRLLRRHAGQGRRRGPPPGRERRRQILLGPLSGDEGVAVANYAKSIPDVTFVNGTSGAQSTTLSGRRPNFFRFGGDGAQWMAGLGTYAYNELGWRKVAILGEDYSFPYTQAAGFVSEFSSLGGEVTARTWVPLTQTDWSSPVAQLPRDVDGVLLLTGGTNTVAAEKAFIQIGKDPGKFLLGGSSVMDPTSFTVGDQLEGLVGGSPVPARQRRRRTGRPTSTASRKAFPDVAGRQPLHRPLLRRHAGDPPGPRPGRAATSTTPAAFQEALAGADADVPQRCSDPGREPQLGPAGLRRADRQERRASSASRWSRRSPDVDQTFGGLFGPDSPDPSRTEPAEGRGQPAAVGASDDPLMAAVGTVRAPPHRADGLSPMSDKRGDDRAMRSSNDARRRQASPTGEEASPLLRMAQEHPHPAVERLRDPERAVGGDRLGSRRRDLQPGHRAGRPAQRPPALAARGSPSTPTSTPPPRSPTSAGRWSASSRSRRRRCSPTPSPSTAAATAGCRSRPTPGSTATRRPWPTRPSSSTRWRPTSS